MMNILRILTALLVAIPIAGQQSSRYLAPGHIDPGPVLRAAAKAMGTDKLNCITFSGTGSSGKVGQNMTQDTDWPPGELLANYTRTINYEARTSEETFEREPGMNPRSWKYGTGWLGGTPLQQNRRQTFAVNADYAWHIDGEGGTAIPAPARAELWQLDIWLNPPGFIKAAMAPGANPTAIWRWEMAESGRDGATTSGIEKLVVVSATVLRKYRVNATINSQNLIQRIQTWVPDPVLGDMNYEHEYTQWQEIDGIKFPAGWHHHDGWDDERMFPVISGGHNSFGGTFADIKPNSCGEPLTVPAAVRQYKPPAPRVESQELAKGVWLLGGSSHNSVAIEFDKFVAVVEAPLDEERSLVVIEQIVKLVPDKPIRFIVNTHAHYDHLGGLRAYLHIGATVITQQRNRLFYETEILNYVPRTLQPDMMSLYPPTEISEGYTMEDVDEKYVITDRTRSLEMYYVQGLGSHVEGMLMAYLPNEKILIEADLYDPPATKPTPTNKTLLDNVRQIGLDVETIAPIHGRPVPWSDFLKVVGQL
ncbi:MAG: MBL fold metallo-hydrolase [Acidobacteria bacterium]|nr:MBL fold metallo-hydrolase [Acidobacteriota bacterium]